MAGELQRMQGAIINYMNSRIKDKNGAAQGVYNKGTVRAYNRTFAADLAVDMPIRDGDSVWYVPAKDNATAVIVGR